MTITPENLVSREVYYCVSYLVSTLAGGYGLVSTQDSFGRPVDGAAGLDEVTEQAMDLASPVDDWEETLTQAGWEQTAEGWRHMEDLSDEPVSLEDAVSESQLDDPYQREVYEHWIVSDWLADKLAEEGEKVDKDFAGMTVWARTTTGQGIASDSVIERICADLNAA